MLEKSISDTWDNEPGKPLFIDRDGDKFALVLDYLRYGSIDSPPSVPQTMIQRELDYYGVVARNTENCGVRTMTFVELTKPAQKDLRFHQIENEMLTLAAEYQLELIKAHGDSGTFCKEETSLKFLDGEGEKLLRKYLEEYFGLTVKVENISMGHIWECQFIISIKK